MLELSALWDSIQRVARAEEITTTTLSLNIVVAFTRIGIRIKVMAGIRGLAVRVKFMRLARISVARMVV